MVQWIQLQVFAWFLIRLKTYLKMNALPKIHKNGLVLSKNYDIEYFQLRNSVNKQILNFN
jgi:hypothetical protein